MKTEFILSGSFVNTQQDSETYAVSPAQACAVPSLKGWGYVGGGQYPEVFTVGATAPTDGNVQLFVKVATLPVGSPESSSEQLTIQLYVNALAVDLVVTIQTSIEPYGVVSESSTTSLAVKAGDILVLQVAESLLGEDAGWPLLQVYTTLIAHPHPIQ